MSLVWGILTGTLRAGRGERWKKITERWGKERNEQGAMSDETLFCAWCGGYHKYPGQKGACEIHRYNYRKEKGKMETVYIGTKVIAAEDKARLDKDFTYHAPKGDQPERYTDIRERAKQFAAFITMNTPASRERSLALTKLEECVFWSNAAIARNEP
jgi:hypothetical protein